MYFQPRLFSVVPPKKVAEFFHSLAADRCHRLRVATDRGAPVFLFMISDGGETLRIARRKASLLVAVGKPQCLFGSNRYLVSISRTKFKKECVTPINYFLRRDLHCERGPSKSLHPPRDLSVFVRHIAVHIIFSKCSIRD